MLKWEQSVVACTIKSIGATEALRLSSGARRPTNSSCIGSKVVIPHRKRTLGSHRLAVGRVKSGRRLNCLSPPVKKPLVMAPNLFSSLRRRAWTVSCTYRRPRRPMAGQFLPRVAYWQSQGWDVIIPDPRGSTGHGRSFTQALHGEWGRADVDDVAAVISECQRRGWSTPSTTAVMGSSSGGMAVLGVLIDYPKSVAVELRLSVSDAASLAGATHVLRPITTTTIGPLGDPRYEERSMVGQPDLIRQPLLLMHGTDDPVVPVAQKPSSARHLFIWRQGALHRI